MKKLLEDRGWVMFYECKDCRGGDRKFFNHPDHKGYDIRIRERTNTASILLNNLVIEGPFWGHQLDAKLTKHGLA